VTLSEFAPSDYSFGTPSLQIARQQATLFFVVMSFIPHLMKQTYAHFGKWPNFFGCSY